VKFASQQDKRRLIFTGTG